MKPEFTGHTKIAVDWLAANGIDELLPAHPEVTVYAGARRIEYSSFVWEGERGWDPRNISYESPTDTSWVDLLVPLSAHTLDALKASGVAVIEYP